jgi:hypothetical protein
LHTVYISSCYFLNILTCIYLFRFDVKIAAAVAEETNLPFVTAENKFEALVSSCMYLAVFAKQGLVLSNQ